MTTSETSRPFTIESLPEGIDPSTLQVREEMLLFVGEYLLDFERAAAAEGLTLAQARVLGFTVRPSSMREIAHKFGCDPSNITAKIERLVELGIAERQVDAGDARVKRIATTPLGIETALRLCQRRTWLAEALGNLSPDEMATVADAMKLLVQVEAQRSIAR